MKCVYHSLDSEAETLPALTGERNAHANTAEVTALT